MAYRFTKGIKSIKIMLKIISTYYATPIIEYCSIVWHQERITLEEQLENFLHYATRMALNTPYLTSHPNYVSFDVRMKRLNLLTYQQRRVIASIVMLVKVMNDH